MSKFWWILDVGKRKTVAAANGISGVVSRVRERWLEDVDRERKRKY